MSHPVSIQPSNQAIKYTNRWLGLILAAATLVSILSAFTIHQFGLATKADVKKAVAGAVAPVDARVKVLEGIAHRQDIVNRCIIWHVDPVACEKELGEPIPKPGGAR